MSIKAQLQELIALVNDQGAMIDELNKKCEFLTQERDRLEGLVGEKEDAMNARVSREIIDLKEEMEHKFALQTAENKRLQHHISLQKKEGERAAAAAQAMQDKLQQLEREVSGE